MVSELSGVVRLGISGPVGQVTLSHPGKFNAVSRTMWRELKAVFEAIQRDQALRCVVVQGEGDHFCSGGDISEYAQFRFAEPSLRAFHESDVWGGLQALLDCDVPIIAKISGNCMGAGLEIASCCDFRLAAESARFGAPIAKLGFPMAPREAALVLRAVGEHTARDMLLAASVFGAREMADRGFLNSVWPEPALPAAVQALTERVSRLAPAAARQNKQSFRALVTAFNGSLATELIVNAYQYADSAEHREGIAAFTEKRINRF